MDFHGNGGWGGGGGYLDGLIDHISLNSTCTSLFALI